MIAVFVKPTRKRIAVFGRNFTAQRKRHFRAVFPLCGLDDGFTVFEGNRAVDSFGLRIYVSIALDIAEVVRPFDETVARFEMLSNRFVARCDCTFTVIDGLSGYQVFVAFVFVVQEEVDGKSPYLPLCVKRNGRRLNLACVKGSVAFFVKRPTFEVVSLARWRII